MNINSENYVSTLFSYYDKLISPYPLSYQAIISFLLLAFLIWNVYVFLRHGHWFWLLVLVAAIPATWPAARKLGEILWLIIKGILFRIQH